MNSSQLQQRAELAMWGCLACAQPWAVVGKPWAFVWAAAAAVAWLVARSAGRKTSIVSRQSFEGDPAALERMRDLTRGGMIHPDKPWPRR